MSILFFKDSFFMSVDELQSHGIGVADIQKLKLAGLCTIKVSSYWPLIVLLSFI